MKKYIFILLGVLTIFFFDNSVFAFSVKDYNSKLALLDEFENIIPVCKRGFGNLCSDNTVPNLEKVLEDFPFLIRYEYKIKDSDEKYYVFEFYNTLPYIDGYNKLNQECYSIDINNNCQGGSKFTISLLPENGYITMKDGTIVALNANYDSVNVGFANPSKLYNVNTVSGYFEFNNSYFNSDLTTFYFDYSNNPYFDIKILTNFDLKNTDDNVIIKETVGHVFETDIDITVPIDNYLLLIPKKSEEFSSYLYTDSNFAYSEMYYDNLKNTYSNINGGGFNEINFGSLGGFNWIRWEFSFSDLDLSFNKSIMLYNHSSTSELHIKIFSSDFEYKLMDSKSSDFCIGDICYKNDYDNFKNFAYSTGEIKNQYDTGDYENGLSFIKSIPSMITDFTKSFAFIGLLFTTIFTIFNGSLANYFYIIFGIMIIMLIIKVLK